MRQFADGKDTKEIQLLDARNYQSRGRFEQDMGHYDKALEMYDKSLKIRLAALGEDHPNVAATYNNMGSLYHSQGQIDKAWEIVRKMPKKYEPVQIVLDEKNSADIRRFLQNKLSDERKLSGRKLSNAVDLLLKKANGMFLFARLALESLPRTMGDMYIQDIENIVKELPSGIESYYEQCFERICDAKSFQGSSLERVLQVIVAAQKQLSVWELAWIIEEDCKTTYDLLKPISGLLLGVLQQNRPKESTVQLCHKSLTDWLTRTQRTRTGTPHSFRGREQGTQNSCEGQPPCAASMH